MTRPISRVMSYNVKCFGILDKNSNILREKVLETISATDADIVCLQEAYWANKPADFPTLDVLSKNLKAKSVQKVRLNNFNYGTGGLAVVTRYKVINQYSHPFDSTANGFMYVDILMNEDTVRLYNCHLLSFPISCSISCVFNNRIYGKMYSMSMCWNNNIFYFVS